MNSGMTRRSIPRGAVAALALGAALLGTTTRLAAQDRSASDFSHQPHRDVTCVSCHRSEGGRIKPASITPQQCQSCHHGGPAAARCTSCHQRAELSKAYSTMQQFRLSFAAQPVSRSVTFEHEQHEGERCASCHQTSASAEVGTMACAGCHEQHHAPEVGCTSCHQSRQPGAGSHGNSSHLTCAGAGCHRASPVPATARTRPVCLACHSDRSLHYAPINCSDCHVMPMAAARQGARSQRP